VVELLCIELVVNGVRNMNGKLSRRDVLQYSTTTVTGLALLSGETVALESKSQPTASVEEKYALPNDLSLHNNSTGETTIEVTAYPKFEDGPMFTGSFSLPGLNDESLQNPTDARGAYQLDLVGDGTYTFQFQLPDGSTASADVTVTEDGIYVPETMTVHVKPSGEIEAKTIIG
jgi:hypothetical protein